MKQLHTYFLLCNREDYWKRLLRQVTLNISRLLISIKFKLFGESPLTDDVDRPVAGRRPWALALARSVSVAVGALCLYCRSGSIRLVKLRAFCQFEHL